MDRMLFKQLTYSKAVMLVILPVIAVMCCLPLKSLRHQVGKLWQSHQVDMGVDKKCAEFPSYTVYLKLNGEQNKPVFDVSFTYLPSCSASTAQIVVNFQKDPVCES